jgi:CBS domain-containing protein
MKVSDILRVKGGTLFTVTPEEPLAQAVATMAERDIGSLVVMNHGDLVGMLTFREVIQAVVKNGGTVGSTIVRTVMDDAPLTCTPETDLDEVRRMMLQRHARYMPVMTQRTLMGVISFYDVAKAVVDSQNFEN